MPRVEIVPRRSAVHARDDRFELFYLLGACCLCEPSANPFVERGPNFVDLIGFLDAHLADEHAAVLGESDQAGFFQCAERLAPRAARHAEALGQCRFVELGSDRQITREDQTLELLLDQHRQRIRAHQRNRRARGSLCGQGHDAGPRYGRLRDSDLYGVSPRRMRAWMSSMQGSKSAMVSTT